MIHSFSNDKEFSAALFEKMKKINPGIKELELYEFRYGLNNLVPQEGWGSVKLETTEKIEKQISQRTFYDGIKIKPKEGDCIVLDENVLRLSRMLLVGLAEGSYAEEWVNNNFYFDIRGFYFLHRTVYFTEKVLAHFGGKPFRQFEKKQEEFATCQEIGYKAFREANSDVDGLFIESIIKLIEVRGTPILLAIAGPTAAGKTEIAERLQEAFLQQGKKIATIELDNFLTDRDEREAKGIFSQGKEALHLEQLIHGLEDITHEKKISVPRYNFIDGTSSHDNNGHLKTGRTPVEIEPADIIFMEGNFPFLIDDIVNLIGIKVVYLTGDEIRLKRKWRRDIDLRKKYEPTYFRNRYFKDQFIMAEIAYRPQMEICDMCVDTTGAALWTTPEIAKTLA
jgi:uridine kinase